MNLNIWEDFQNLSEAHTKKSIKHYYKTIKHNESRLTVKAVNYFRKQIILSVLRFPLYRQGGFS